MPRTREITWQTRIRAFRLYRLNKGKVYPVAKELRMARSTITHVINDFLDSGFSKAPRANLSVHLLARAQELHMEEVIRSLRKPLLITVPPERKTRSERGHFGDVSIYTDPSGLEGISVDRNYTWHLRGTEAEGSNEDLENAFREYDDLCMGLWRNLATDLERLSKVKLVRIDDWQENDEKPVMFDSLVDVLYRKLLVSNRGKIDSVRDEISWRSDAGSKYLWANNTRAAFGEESEHDAVRRAVAELVARTFSELDTRALQLRLFHEDLKYLGEALNQLLGEITDSAIRSGICPACPYPEASAEDWKP